MHIKAKHSGTFKHKCEHCTYECPEKQALDRHIIAKHPEHGEKEKEFVCPDACCEFESLTKAGLRSHYLLKHMASHVAKFLGKSDNGIQCTHCGNEFKSKPSFVYHLPGCLPESVKTDSVKEGLCI